MLQTALSDDSIRFNESYSYNEKYNQPIQTILRSIKYRFTEESGTLVLAPSNHGKTKLSAQILKDNFVSPSQDQDNPFGIYVEAPGSGLNELYELILIELNDISPKSGKVFEKKGRIIDLVNKLDLKVMFIDEIQVALPAAGLLPTSEFVKNIKEVLNRANCALVFLGVPEAEQIISVDKQLAHRFPRVITIEGFSCLNEDCELDFMEFLFDLLGNFPRGIPYLKCLNDSITDEGFSYAEGVNYENILRLCLASMGTPGNLSFLLTECIEITKPEDKVTKKILEEAFNNCFPGNFLGLEFNPFSATRKQVIEALQERGLYA